MLINTILPAEHRYVSNNIAVVMTFSIELKALLCTAEVQPQRVAIGADISFKQGTVVITIGLLGVSVFSSDV